MINNDFKTINKPLKTIFTNDGIAVSKPEKFYNNVINRTSTVVPSAENYNVNNTLLYADSEETNDMGLQEIIIDLLNQLRAYQDKQNSIITTSFLSKEHIIDRLQFELNRAIDVIGKQQVQNVQNIINNNLYDNRKFNEVVNSILSSKKKT